MFRWNLKILVRLNTEVGMADEQEKATRADVFLRLAERASARFDSRRPVELGVTYAIWGGLGGSSVAVITSNSFVSFNKDQLLSGWLIFAVISIGLGLALHYFHSEFLHQINKANWQDSRTSYWWEQLAMIEVGESLPSCLSNHPQSRVAGSTNDQSVWLHPLDAEGCTNGASQYPRCWNCPTCPSSRRMTPHPLQRFQVGVSMSLYVFLCVAIVERIIAVGTCK